MKVAVITGASSGIGKNFVMQIDRYFDLDEIYVIARRVDLLNELQEFTKAKIVPLSLDLSNRESFNVYEVFLKENNPDIKLLINCAGFGKFGDFTSISKEVNMNMVDLNCNALQVMTYLSIPYMKEEARIVQVASMSSIQPVPYINLYAATKAFVFSFSRALNVELRKKKIHVIALTPYWVGTSFFDVANKNDFIKYYDIIYKPEYIVEKCYKHISKKKPKDVCVPGKFARAQYRLVKLLPHKLVMKIWLKKEHLK